MKKQSLIALLFVILNSNFDYVISRHAVVRSVSMFNTCHNKNATAPKDKIYRDVLCDLSTYDRPVKTADTTIYVNLTFIPVSVSVTEEQKIVKVNGYLVLKWIDQNISWRPSRYNRIQSVDASPYDIWTPRITSYDSGSQYKFLEESDRLKDEDPVICYNGSITLRKVGSFFGPCRVDSTQWPFEQWQCTFTIARYLDDDGLTAVNFDFTKDIDYSLLEEDNLWQLLNTPQFVRYDNEQYVEFLVVLQRNVSHYQAIFVYPGIIMLILSLISLLLSTLYYFRLIINVLTATIQLTFVHVIFMILEEIGTSGVAIYSFYLDGMMISITCVLMTVIHAKLNIKSDHPPQILIEMIGVVAAIPFVGPVISYVINDDSKKGGEDDETGLVNALGNKYNQKWTIVGNFLDFLLFISFISYMIIYYGLIA